MRSSVHSVTGACMVSDRFTFQIDHLFSAHCELNRQLMEVFVQI